MTLNSALEHSDQPLVEECLIKPELYLYSIPECMNEYYTQLQLLQASKKEAGIL